MDPFNSIQTTKCPTDTNYKTGGDNGTPSFIKYLMRWGTITSVLRYSYNMLCGEVEIMDIAT